MKKYYPTKNSTRDILKTTRVYDGNKRVRNIYVGSTWRERMAKRINLAFTRLLRVLIIGSISYGLFAGIVWWNEPVKKVEAQSTVQQEIIIRDTLKAKVDVLKNEIVDGIKDWETKGIPIPKCDGKIIFDSNKVASIGCYMFQVKTVIYYVKILEGRDITEAEAIAIATDHVKARALAYRIVWEKNALSPNWYNYSKLAATQQKLSIINQLQQ